jgi:hypothetical protein
MLFFLTYDGHPAVTTTTLSGFTTRTRYEGKKKNWAICHPLYLTKNGRKNLWWCPVKPHFSTFQFLSHIGLGFCSPGINTVVGCDKTWKYTVVPLAELCSGSSNVASWICSCFRLPKKLSATELCRTLSSRFSARETTLRLFSQQFPTRLMLADKAMHF